MKSQTKSKLPPAAILLNPTIKKKIGNWIEMEFDAEVTRYGLTWLRVKNGMGGDGNMKSQTSEDWILDLPAQCVSIHDYQWDKTKKWGPVFYGTFDAAALGEMKHGLEQAQTDREQILDRLVKCQSSIEILNRHIPKQ